MSQHYLCYRIPVSRHIALSLSELPMEKLEFLAILFQNMWRWDPETNKDNLSTGIARRNRVHWIKI